MPAELQEAATAKPVTARFYLSGPKETYIAALASACILVNLALRYVIHAPSWITPLPLYVTLIAGGCRWSTIWSASSLLSNSARTSWPAFR